MTDLVPLREAGLQGLDHLSPAMQQMLKDLLPQLGQALGELAPRIDAARAYVYSGSWVADCPAGCNNTEFLTEQPRHLRGVAHNWGVRKAVFHCSYCGFVTDQIQWPPKAEDIQQALDRRPIPHTRNWYPEGHPVAVRAGIPHGQTVEQLVTESREHGVT